MARLRPIDRGWAATAQDKLLDWRVQGSWQVAELPRAKWFVEPTPFEVKAWAEIKLLGNRYRHEIGVFRTAAEAMAACERDAVACSARKAEAEAPVDIRIAPPKQRVAIYRRKAPPSK